MYLLMGFILACLLAAISFLFAPTDIRAMAMSGEHNVMLFAFIVSHTCFNWIVIKVNS